MQRIEQGALALRVAGRHRVIEDERADLAGPHEMARESESQQQIDLLGGAVRQELGAAPLPAVGANLYPERFRVDLAVGVALRGDPRQPLPNRGSEHRGDVAVHSLLGLLEEADRRRQRPVEALHLLELASRRLELLLGIDQARQTGGELLEAAAGGVRRGARGRDLALAPGAALRRRRSRRSGVERRCPDPCRPVRGVRAPGGRLGGKGLERLSRERLLQRVPRGAPVLAGRACRMPAPLPPGEHLGLRFGARGHDADRRRSSLQRRLRPPPPIEVLRVAPVRFAAVVDLIAQPLAPLHDGGRGRPRRRPGPSPGCPPPGEAAEPEGHGGETGDREVGQDQGDAGRDPDPGGDRRERRGGPDAGGWLADRGIVRFRQLPLESLDIGTGGPTGLGAGLPRCERRGDLLGLPADLRRTRRTVGKAGGELGGAGGAMLGLRRFALGKHHLYCRRALLRRPRLLLTAVDASRMIAKLRLSLPGPVDGCPGLPHPLPGHRQRAGARLCRSDPLAAVADQQFARSGRGPVGPRGRSGPLQIFLQRRGVV